MKALETDGIRISVVKLNIVCPLTDDLINTLMSFDNILTFEEGILSGSVSEKIASLLLQSGYRGTFKINAVTGFVKAGKRIVTPKTVLS